MSKNKKVIIAASVIIVLLAVIAYFFFPIKPLSSLNMTDIEEIQVFCAPPEQTVVLNQEEAAKVITLLQDTQMYQRGFVSTSTTGQVVKFTIIQSDGTETEIGLYVLGVSPAGRAMPEINPVTPSSTSAVICSAKTFFSATQS